MEKENKTMRCPDCGSTHIWKVGWFPTKKLGKRQRYKCAECATTFYVEG